MTRTASNGARALERYAEFARRLLCLTCVQPVVTDPRVLQAMLSVPRHWFMPAEVAELAYDDRPVPIGHDATISQPSLVAQMTDALRVERHHTVLEVGTGSGYQAALLGCLARAVVTVEHVPALARRARSALRRLDLENVKVVVGDGSLGVPRQAPYDRVIITAAAPVLPEAIKRQVRDGGMVVVPIGALAGQRVVRYTRHGDRWEEVLVAAEVRFVPLLGEQGWASYQDMLVGQPA